MKKGKHRIVPIILSFVLILPLVSTSSPLYSISPSHVVINEVLPNPSNDVEWVELYNTTDHQIDISGCYIDDNDLDRRPGPYKIPDGVFIPPRGSYVIKIRGILNNNGDTVNLLSNDLETVIDSYSFGKSKRDESWYRCPDGGAWQIKQTSFVTQGAANKCASSVAFKGLEIHHIDVGQADATFIISPTGKTMLIDLGESLWSSYKNAETVADYILKNPRVKSRHIDYLVITHFHLDHVGYIDHGGLWALVNKYNFTFGKTVHRDYGNYLGTVSSTFTKWRDYLEKDGKGAFNPVVAHKGSGQIDLGTGVIVNIIVSDGNGVLKKGDFSGYSDPPSENDYSIGLIIKFGKFDEWIGGDLSGINTKGKANYLYHDIESSAAREVGDVDVYRVNHHGSSHSSNLTFIEQLDPDVSIISVGIDNGYKHPDGFVVDRLLETSDVYFTEYNVEEADVDGINNTGNIVVNTVDGTNYTVNDVKYTATDPVRIDKDRDGYFKEVDPNDNNPSIIPSINASSKKFKRTIYMK